MTPTALANKALPGTIDLRFTKPGIPDLTSGTLPLAPFATVVFENPNENGFGVNARTCSTDMTARVYFVVRDPFEVTFPTTTEPARIGEAAEKLRNRGYKVQVDKTIYADAAGTLPHIWK